MEVGSITQLSNQPWLSIKEDKELINLLRQIDDKLAILLQYWEPLDENQLVFLQKKGWLSEQLQEETKSD